MSFFERIIPVTGYAIEFHFIRYRQRWLIILIVVAALVVALYVLIAPPRTFPSGVIVAIPHGLSAREAAYTLAANGVIMHPSVLAYFFSLTDARIQAGAYRFNEPENLPTIAHRLIIGSFDIPAAHITFLEGETVRDMAARVNATFPIIATSTFIAAAESYEGYLFPDTYVFSAADTADTIAKAMHTNFETQITPLIPYINMSGHSLSSIIIMASLIEREARTSADKRIVAGILWNRIAKNMPLQVDAVFSYIFGRDTYSPSFADLKVDSLYNTYIHKGLPPGPIDNPGLDSIEAALYPTKTNYLYYLTDANGQMHYAMTYVAQLANQRIYLN